MEEKRSVPASSLSSTGSFLIRAPLTLDSDSDFESSGEFSGVESSDNGSGSEYYEFDTASETVEDNGVAEKSNFVRAFVDDSDNDDSVESVESFAADVEETQESGVVEKNLDENPFTPVALLSVEDEGDGILGYEEIVSDVETGDFSGAVKIPDSVNNSPRINDALMGVESEELSNFAFVGQASSFIEEKIRRLENSVVDDESNGDVSMVEGVELEGPSNSALVGLDSSLVEVDNPSLENSVVDDESHGDVLMVEGVESEEPSDSVLAGRESSLVEVGNLSLENPVVDDESHGDVSLVEGVESKEASNSALVGQDSSLVEEENRSLESSVVDDESHGDVLMVEGVESEEPSNSALVEQDSSLAEVENRSLEYSVVDDESHGDTPKAYLEYASENEENSSGDVLKLDQDGYDVADGVENVAADEVSKIEELESPSEIDLGAELHEPLAVTEVESIEQPLESLLSFSSQEILNTVKGGSPVSTDQSEVLLPSDGIQNVDSSEVLQQISTREVADIENSESIDQSEIAEENSNQMEGERIFLSDKDVEELIFETVNQQVDQGLASPSYSTEDSRDHSDTADMKEEGMELMDSSALTNFIKAATSVETDGGSISVTSKDGSEPSLLEPSNHSGSSIQSSNDDEKKIIEKIQRLKVKFLRLVRRLGSSLNDSLVAQVLYRLALATRGRSSPDFNLELAKKVAMQLEADGVDLGFSLNILVLGKSGVGKSATINSILCEEKARVDAFEPATNSVKEIAGNVNGVKIRIFDTPGLRSPTSGEAANRKILASIKKFTRKYPPDVVLYVDRLDTNARDFMDFPVLKSVTSSLGSSIWQNTIITLTHAASTLPDGPSGSPLSYDVFVAQKSHVVEQALSQAVGDLRLMNPSMMHPVSLVENNPSHQKEIDGESVNPSKESWRPHLLLLCYSLKILAEAKSMAKPQDPFDFQKLLGLQLRSPPLPYFLSSLLQSRAHPKLSADNGDVDSDVELGNSSDSDEEDEDEFDNLPPFKPLGRSQVANLSKEQRKAYFDEYDYRVKLLQKKQWRDEMKRWREMKKKGRNVEIYAGDEGDQEEGPATVAVPLPDMILPPSFDGDSPGYRYRSLDSASELLVRPVLDSNGWDHDIGYDGVSIKRNLAVAGCFPGAVAVQITKGKKEFSIHLDSSVCAKTGEKGSTMAGFDIQAVGRQLAYIFRGETKFKVLNANKMTTGLSVTRLGETVATGLKVEDQVALGKRLLLSTSAGTMRSQGENAYGANVEFRLNDKNFPIEQDHTTMGLSLMKWRNDLAVMANLQSQLSIGRSSKMAVRVGLNNKQSGQITIKISSSEHLQIALSALLPIAVSIFRNIFSGTD